MKKRTHSQTASPVTNTVYATASIVTALSVAERGLGFLYRIVLSRLIGAEGLGLYQVALSLFAVFLTIGTGGIPITVSRLISKSKAENDPKGERGAVSAGILLSLLLTVPVVLVLLPFADKFTFLFSDERCAPVFRILLIGLCFSAVYAVFRGSFWGNKSFLFPSVIEIAEETVMVIAGVLLLQNVSDSLTGAKLAAWAVVISYLFSFTLSTVGYFVCGGRLSSPERALKPLFTATLPITSVRASGSLVNSAVAVLLPAMLVRAGYQSADALELFGVVSGMAMPVLFIPATIIGSLSLVLVPELSEDFYRKNEARLYKNLERGIRVAFLVACVLLPFFYALGNRLGALAFSNLLAGEIISKGCVILLPMSLTMITTGMLNSMGFERQTFLYYFIGAAAMLLCILLLPSVCGVYAYVIGLGVSYVLTSLCNLLLLKKKCGGLFKKHGKGLLFTATRGVIAVLPLSLIGKLFSALFARVFGATLTAIATAVALALCTVLLYFLLGLFSKNELKEAFSLGKRKKAANR
ncbi:MAG: oligosaccharide flippase family protein [Clostridia bacterium]|nr:oligosaccharide flippase family protein [Clostridia bacterium]